jgi:hypothetical protein
MVNLRYAHGSQMKAFFKDWLDNWPDPYPQRYRKNIPYRWAHENGALLMTLTNGEGTYPEPAKTDAATRNRRRVVG